MGKLNSGRAADANGDGIVSPEEQRDFERQQRQDAFASDAKKYAEKALHTNTAKNIADDIQKGGNVSDAVKKGAESFKSEAAKNIGGKLSDMSDGLSGVNEALGGGSGALLGKAAKTAGKLGSTLAETGGESLSSGSDGGSEGGGSSEGRKKPRRSLWQSAGRHLLSALTGGAKSLSYGVLKVAGDTSALGVTTFKALSSTALGSIGAGTVMGLGAMGAVGGTAYTVSYFTNATNIARWDEDPFDDPCGTKDDPKGNSAASDSKGAGGEITSAEQLENARRIYSVMSEYGLSDEQVAGMLGNFEVESGVNPNKFESDMIGAVKPNARELAAKDGASVETMFNGGWGAFSAAYAAVGISLDEATYLGIGEGDKNDGTHWPGIGLGQWTGVGARGLSKFATSNNRSMWDLDTQLIYMLSNVPSDASYFPRLEKYKGTSGGSAAEFGALFARIWEGNTAVAQGERQANATKWLVEIKKMSKDGAYAKSILSQTKNVSASSSVSKSKDDKAAECAEDGGSDSKNRTDTGYLMKKNYQIVESYYQYGPGGSYHHGVDITTTDGQSEGTDLYAAASGTVVTSDNTTDTMGGATCVVIKLDDGNGYLLYAHMVTGSNKPKVGDHLDKGDYVGKLGNTGVSTGPHLHFQYSPASNDGAPYLAYGSGGSPMTSPPDPKYTKNPQPYLKGVDSEDQIDGRKVELSSNPLVIDVSK